MRKRRKNDLILYKKFLAENTERELDVYREKEEQKRGKSKLFLVFVSIIIVVLAACGLPKIQELLQLVPREIVPELSNLEIGAEYELIGDIEVDTQTMMIQGVIQNNQDYQELLRITITLYDANNNKLGELTHGKCAVAAGAQWEFSMSLADTEIDVTKLKYCRYNITGGRENEME